MPSKPNKPPTSRISPAHRHGRRRDPIRTTEKRQPPLLLPAKILLTGPTAAERMGRLMSEPFFFYPTPGNDRGRTERALQRLREGEGKSRREEAGGGEDEEAGAVYVGEIYRRWLERRD